ncbi:MAG: hypothetical protein Q4B52_07225 [Tissierellia bacterium]|nr:hypothetical protein [Tissierellia bacterium]
MLKRFFFYIITQDNEDHYEFKVSKFILNILFLALSTIFSVFAIVFIKDIKSIPYFLRVIIIIYLCLGAFCCAPSESIAMDKSFGESSLFNFGFYTLRGIFLSPLYLMRYAKMKSKKQKSKK